MYDFNIVENNTHFSILNTVSDVTVYYSKAENDFVAFCVDEVVPPGCVEVPYVDEIETFAMREFWAKLGRSEITRPREEYRFLSYIRQHGLVDDYCAFLLSTLIPYVKAWARETGITIDWDNYSVI